METILKPFAERGLRPSLVDVLVKKGYTEPTPIQQLTFDHFTSGHHIVGQSQTGSGKTAAFLLPILNAMNPKEAAPQVLILAPTRELALQTEEEAFALTRGLFGAKSCLVCGGMSFFKQKQRVQTGANIIVGTPGRILEMLQKKIIHTNQLKYFVLDEVDRMLDMGFQDEVEAIWSLLPTHMQVMCFSATMPSELIRLFGKYLPAGYQHIEIEKQKMTVDTLDHAFVRLAHMEKLSFLTQYLQLHDFQKVVVFVQTKRSVGELHGMLKVGGYTTLELHGDIDQYGRIRAMREFKTSTSKVILVATDVASRGLNFNDVDLVVNFDMPQDPEDYIHRVGRTARAGKSGKALMLVGNDEDRKLRMLERANKMQIKELDKAGNVVHRVIRDDAGPRTGGFTRRRRGGSRPQGGGGYGRRPSSGSRPTYSGGKDARPSYGQSRPDSSRPGGERRYASPDKPRSSYPPRSNNSRPAYGSSSPQRRTHSSPRRSA